MVMMGLKFMGREPFADVFVTGRSSTPVGWRMSKDKDERHDPLRS
jgi:valyl-tRNA synthetase